VTLDQNTESINRQLIQLPSRAERQPSDSLARTFVDVGLLFARLSTEDHQVIYGRRGTGKTHALHALVNYAYRRGHAAVFIDTVHLGSAGVIYNDPTQTLSERGTALLVDVLQAIHEGIFRYALGKIPEGLPQELLESLDAFADSIIQTRVVGSFERESATKAKSGIEDTLGGSISLSPTDLGLKIGARYTKQEAQETEIREREAGSSRPSIHFGAVTTGAAKECDLSGD
jgi:Cdc6-like AAA superfamily ATPase